MNNAIRILRGAIIGGSATYFVYRFMVKIDNMYFPEIDHSKEDEEDELIKIVSYGASIGAICAYMRTSSPIDIV